ncbi:hypothetical protein M758_UG260200 [Ceratodon purpureus]|nr:hypothetical protein M758_UG260200 [Ceratodon purpureus]
MSPPFATVTMKFVPIYLALCFTLGSQSHCRSAKCSFSSESLIVGDNVGDH